MKKKLEYAIAVFLTASMLCCGLPADVFAEPQQAAEDLRLGEEQQEDKEPPVKETQTEPAQTELPQTETSQTIVPEAEPTDLPASGTDRPSDEQSEEPEAEMQNTVPEAEEDSQGEQEEPLQTLEQIPDVSEDVSVEDQIIVIYEESQEDNVENLDLDITEMAEGESLCETVDLLVPEEPAKIDQLIDELENKPGVAAVSRNETMELFELPNDRYIVNGYAWQFQMTGADVTWDKVSSRQTVKVAVIDSGLDIRHPDLAGRYEIGYDYVKNTRGTMDDAVGHGTEISGLIAAAANNSIGIAGIAGSAPVKVVAYRAGGTHAGDRVLNAAYVVAAMEEIAKRPDIQIVNMSFGSEKLDAVKREAVRRLQAAGKVLVAACGNDGNTVKNYPASCEGVISVGSVNSQSMVSGFSNRNDSVDLCAPGDAICTTGINNAYGYVSGTSFSAPLVAGAAAVLKCVDNGLTAAQIERILEKTAKDLGPAGRDDSYGYGMIRLDKAVEEAEKKMPVISYQTHIQKSGWQSEAADGDMSGTEGKSLRMEGIKINVNSTRDLGVTYRTHVQGYGWQPYVNNSAMSGTSGESKRLEAIQIKLTGADAGNFDIYYQVHAQGYGWLGWAKNGMAAGTEGYAKRLEAIRIVIVSKGSAAPGTTENPFYSLYTTGGVRYRTHVQKIGWQGYVNDGALSGTTMKSLRLEGMNVRLGPDIDGGIQYRTHVQRYGWEDSWKSDGTLSGTSGRSLRLEAVQMKLTGEAANRYDIYYRVHCQRFGWLGWAKNGESAGSAGYSYRLEAVEIRLVEKGNPAPGSTANTYYER